MRKFLFAAASAAVLLSAAGVASAADNVVGVQINNSTQTSTTQVGVPVVNMTQSKVNTQAIGNSIDVESNDANLTTGQFNNAGQVAATTVTLSNIGQSEINSTAVGNSVNIRDSNSVKITGGVVQTNSAPQVSSVTFDNSSVADVKSVAGAIGNNYSAEANNLQLGTGSGLTNQYTVVNGGNPVYTQSSYTSESYTPSSYTAGQQMNNVYGPLYTVGIGTVINLGNGSQLGVGLGAAGHDPVTAYSQSSYTPEQYTPSSYTPGSVLNGGEAVYDLTVVGTPAVGLQQVNNSTQTATITLNGATSVSGNNSFGAQAVGNNMSFESANTITTAGFFSGFGPLSGGQLLQVNNAGQTSVGTITGSNLISGGVQELTVASIGNSMSFNAPNLNIGTQQMNFAPQVANGYLNNSTLINLDMNVQTVGNSLSVAPYSPSN